MPDLAALIDRIRALIDEPATLESRVPLAEIEHTLTDGYAHALVLEGEHWRIEKQIGELARELHDPNQARELRHLTLKLVAAEDDLTRLRGLLRVLQERATATRGSLRAVQARNTSL